ncbi:hypothetical protein GCM10009765_36360 [Fodinicola feengrottensis]|uniref:Uncharacterized protein n=1 Tax=Fodinicola feengrottensis TaxID=435914 RepID=A0ABN2H8R3_9ACTN
MKRLLSVRVWTALVALAVAAGAVLAAAPAAQADTILNAVYDVNGTSMIKKTGSVLTLGPTKLSAVLDLDTSTFTADLPLPPAQSTFKILGLLPVSATTTFVNVGQTTGTVDQNTGGMTSISKVIIRLSNVKVGGIPTLVGPHCESVSPATIQLTGKDGFNAVLGGPVGGTYTIPPFGHCLLQQLLINQLIPGPGNTIDATLGPPVITEQP